MQNHDPVVIDEINHNLGIAEIELEAISELCDMIVAEKTLVVESIWTALYVDGHVESLADAYTDPNPAARDAGIELHLRTLGISIKRAVEAEAKKRYDALVDSVAESAAQDADDDARDAE